MSHWLFYFMVMMPWQEVPTSEGSFSFASVRIPVWVQNFRQRPVTGLKAKDFKVYVDGKRVHYENFINSYERPMEVVYLLDLSGSMAIGGKLIGSIETITYLIGRHRKDDRWQVVVFSDSEILSIVNQTNESEWYTLAPKLKAYGKTALFDALSSSSSYFGPGSLNNRAIILFTDGNDNQSSLTELQLYQVLEKLDVPVFIVAIADGFLPEKNVYKEKLGLKTLQEITRISGGKLFLAKDRSALQGISKDLDRNLRPQYLLTMTVERGPQDRYHGIEVKLKLGKTRKIRHRTGYIGLMPEVFGGSQ